MSARPPATRRSGLALISTLVVAIRLTTSLLPAADPGRPSGLASRPPSPTTNARSGLPPEPPLRMIFPASPPPLGALMPRFAQDDPPLSAAVRALSGEILEPYFAPLSTYPVEPWRRLNKNQGALLDDYRVRRAELVAELRRTIERVRSAPPAERLAAFAALAAAQEPRLVAWEKAAEALRASLALEMDWYERREWQLGRGDLNLPREKVAVIEYQVLRAAAFYRGDLTPAQRRLLREAAWRLEHQVFADRDPAAESFQFFSPDMMLVRFPAGLSSALADEIALHAARKEALRQELRDAIYETDGALSFARGRTLRRLAEEQGPRAAALEDLAEKIRLELADHDHSWRRSPPAVLPLHLGSRLDAYLAARQQLRAEYLSAVEPIVATPPSAAIRIEPEALRAWQDNFRDRLKQATADFEREHAARADELEQDAVALDEALASSYEPVDSGGTASDTVLNFVHRRRVEEVYFEYDIAAFEPGLSPRQRTLLFAAAVARLDLPLPDAERQPVKAPKTLLK